MRERKRIDFPIIVAGDGSIKCAVSCLSYYGESFCISYRKIKNIGVLLYFIGTTKLKKGDSYAIKI